MGIKAFIAGCEGHVLSAQERDFFRAEQPWGFILFGRNIAEPDQVKALTDSLRDCAGRADTPILIDQEGGRVRRLRPPHWPDYPAGRALGDVYGADNEAGLRAAWCQGRLMASDLAAIGVNVDCAPVLDVPQPEAHEVIGDRAYSTQPYEVARIGRALADGLLAGGVLPVIKHVPGHGRANVDSHADLPIVDTHPGILGCTDFYPFMQLADLPMAMTAHVVYSGFDANRAATASGRMIEEIIRGWIGFDGLLMSDDVSMHALSGDYGERTQSVFAAGCDIVLHCNGDMAQMRAVAEAAPELAGKAAYRAHKALEWLKPAEPGDLAALREELENLVKMAPAAEPQMAAQQS